MEIVVSVNLGGVASQIEQSAHEALKAYLARAEHALSTNPDKAEILADLEAAIGDRCAGRISSHKTVVSGAEMTAILDEMGPVRAEDDAEPPPDGATEPPPRSERSSSQKRLYRLRDGARFAGVCSGLAAYFDADVTLIRVLFVVATILTHGIGLLVYAVMMFVVPSANTSAEWSEAHGLVFNAQELVDEAGHAYDRFRSGRGWRRSWRRSTRRAWRAPPPPSEPLDYAGRILGGVLAFALTVASVAILVAFIATLAVISAQRAHIAPYLPVDWPWWTAIIMVCAVFAAVAIPLQALRRLAWRASDGDAGDALDGLLWIALIGLCIWLAWQIVPQSNASAEAARAWIEQQWQAGVAWWSTQIAR